ncbi:MAG: outer membrane protein assembly factor BamA, partial [Candidatus Electrothrix sp. AUS1_2]|nr:outer membrane protein assembly factor BamA [Candidatus Electrothrix sp. AUS1_2]
MRQPSHYSSQAQCSVQPIMPLPRFVAIFLSVLFFALAGKASALEQNTVFLPLKINAENSASVAQRADVALEGALRDKDMLMLTRLEAAEQVDYNGPWPPSAAVLTKVAEDAGRDYVAVGSLTMLGEHISVDMQVIDLLKPEEPYSSYQEGSSLSEIHSVLKAALLDILSYTNRNFIIAKITPEGNKRIDSGAIRRKIAAKPGDTYSPDSLRKDLKQVFSMGYFDNVEIEVNDSAEGKQVIF